MERKEERMVLPTELSDAYAQVRVELAQRGLSHDFAKLYSQHTLLSSGQVGLRGWRTGEAALRQHDAMRLVATALAEREDGVEGWQDSSRRAAEILEWLSHDELNEDGLPLLLLSSAAYQLAGYPARSLGLLNQERDDNQVSRVLSSFLRADFVNLFNVLADYWEERPSRVLEQPLPWNDENDFSTVFRNWVIGEILASLGVLCSHFRWGDETRVDAAINKMTAVADLLLHDRDPYSWLVAKLCAEVADEYQDTSLRHALSQIVQSLPSEGRQAFELYLRLNYTNAKSLAWPSQFRGIEQLAIGGSFALCTPTGSGKTTVAEIAILNGLFSPRTSTPSFGQEPSGISTPDVKPLALYLVPSRALATEVESKLNRVLSSVSNERIIVTGLYGGNDWGPTDAWLTANERVVLICTYEKAEALMRFLSPLFLDRVSVIVLDEAHNVQFTGNMADLAKNESRSLRLESLMARVLTYIQNLQFQCIALSAVASGFSNVLAQWMSGSYESVSVQTSYQSTRKLVGSLDCFLSGRTEIRYQLLDGWALRPVAEGSTERPFVPNPFPTCPMSEQWVRSGPEKRLRPFLFWAAIHLAAADTTGRERSVLISVTQQIGGYAEDFLVLMSRDWSQTTLPEFFHVPTERRQYELWEQCLAACEDYFTTDSREYELLEKGIVLHHGKMPGLLARLLVELIEERIIHIVLATSTLSEGVNLPFETVLIPSLRRSGTPLSASEFNNLTGRAGRPGYSTEGRSLVLLPAEGWSPSQARGLFTQLIQSAANLDESPSTVANAQSPLAVLLRQIRMLWQRISNSDSDSAFLDWLERAVPSSQNYAGGSQDAEAVNLLDTLDGVLLSAVVELEQLTSTDVDIDTLEARLREIWQHTYAHFASLEEVQLSAIFLRRGRSLVRTIYPVRTQRRRIYRTGLTPVAGLKLIDIYGQLRTHLETGSDYADWPAGEKIEYIKEIVRQIAQVREFALSETLDWENVLLWWLSPRTASQLPTRTSISGWHNYVSQHFQYRFNWGLGSIVALAIDDAYGGELRLPSLADWPLTGLPWIVFWLKELMVWGTLDPVAAFLLSHKLELTRSNAEETAQQYYRLHQSSDANEQLNAITVRRWIDNLVRTRESVTSSRLPRRMQAHLLRDFAAVPAHQWRVIPVERDHEIHWLDPAGFSLAKSERPENWEPSLLHEDDFFLDPRQGMVISQPYL